jgi:hypothetical protein
MTRRPDLPCAACGKLMWRGRGVLPEGRATCRPCRRANPISMEPGKRKPRKMHTQTCKHCGVDYERRVPNKGWCSTKCYGDSRVVRADCDWGVTRGKREASAPGLTKNGRDKLRHKWKQQNKPCAYCGARADTIDHVMPLVRGGTNYEGNLVPACRRCNSSKSGKTIIEWRHGVSLGKVREASDWMGKPRVHRERKPKPVTVLREPHACPMCQMPTLRMKYCSQECATERERRYIRDKWRARNGLTVDPMRPTSKWAA